MIATVRPWFVLKTKADLKKSTRTSVLMTVTGRHVHLLCPRMGTLGLCVIGLLVINEVIFSIGKRLTQAFFFELACWDDLSVKLMGLSCTNSSPQSLSKPLGL